MRMDAWKFKSLTMFALFLLLSLYPETSLGKPVISQPRRIPKFLKNLYVKLMMGKMKLPIHVTSVHGVFARVKPLCSDCTRASDVQLLTNFTAVTPALKRTARAELHVHVLSGSHDSRNSHDARRGGCKLEVHDVWTSRRIVTRKIKCRKSAIYHVTVTKFANKWLKHPSTNQGVRVQISSDNPHDANARLPFVSATSPHEPPYYVLYV